MATNVETAYRVGYGPVNSKAVVDDEKPCRHLNLGGTVFLNETNEQRDGFQCLAFPGESLTYRLEVDSKYYPAPNNYFYLFAHNNGQRGIAGSVRSTYNGKWSITMCDVQYYPYTVGTSVRYVVNTLHLATNSFDSPEAAVAYAIGACENAPAQSYNRYSVGSTAPITGAFTREDLLNGIAALDRYVGLTYGSPDSGELGEIAHSAINNIKVFDSNVLLYLIELKSMGKGVLDQLEGLKSMIKGFSLKTAADLYLSNKYGLPLTWAETMDMAEALAAATKLYTKNREHYKCMSSGNVTIPSLVKGVDDIIGYCSYKVVYDDFDSTLTNLWKSLEDWGVNPFNLSRLWDAVPYSFVINWFFDVSYFLEVFDSDMYKYTLDIKYVTYSYKYSLPEDLLTRYLGSHPGLNGSVYTRCVRPKYVHSLPPFSYSNSAADHVAELSALIIQRKNN